MYNSSKSILFFLVRTNMIRIHPLTEDSSFLEWNRQFVLKKRMESTVSQNSYESTISIQKKENQELKKPHRLTKCFV